MRREKGGRWRLGVYWSWHDDWMLGIVRVPPLGISSSVIGPLRIVVMRPVYRIVAETQDHACTALQASTPA
jgi:hypothetical protein